MRGEVRLNAGLLENIGVLPPPPPPPPMLHGSYSTDINSLIFAGHYCGHMEVKKASQQKKENTNELSITIMTIK